MIDLANFRPRRLESALLKVRREHPVREGAEESVPRDYLSEVRQKLAGTPASEIKALAAQFMTRELKACLMLLCLDETDDIHEKAEKVVILRQRKDLLGFSWNLLKIYYPVDRLERFVRAVGGKFQWILVSRDEDEKNRIARWFAQPQLASGVLSDFLASKRSDLGEWLRAGGVEVRHGLHRAVINTLLVNFDLHVIQRLGHAYLLALARNSPVPVQTSFGQRYLNVLQGRREWEEPVLEWILAKFDVPPDSEKALTPFWRAVDDNRRREFRRWANEAVLRDFFGGIKDPHGRFQFWQQFFDDLVRARKTYRGDIAFLDFGHFGVVEFSEMGNAAYIYPKSHFESMQARAERGLSHPAAFKDQTQTLGGDGRIIHRQGWQSRYAPWIHALLRRR